MCDRLTPWSSRRLELLISTIVRHRLIALIAITTFLIHINALGEH
jgi:hypothetical protein